MKPTVKNRNKRKTLKYGSLTNVTTQWYRNPIKRLLPTVFSRGLELVISTIYATYTFVRRSTVLLSHKYELMFTQKMASEGMTCGLGVQHNEWTWPPSSPGSHFIVMDYLILQSWMLWFRERESMRERGERERERGIGRGRERRERERERE